MLFLEPLEWLRATAYRGRRLERVAQAVTARLRLVSTKLERSRAATINASKADVGCTSSAAIASRRRVVLVATAKRMDEG